MAGLSGRALLPDLPECVSIIKPPLISVSAFALKIRVYLYSSVVKCLRLQHLDERLLQDVHVADGFHPLFAFLLLFEQFAFARDVAAVAFAKADPCPAWVDIFCQSFEPACYFGIRA